VSSDGPTACFAYGGEDALPKDEVEAYEAAVLEIDDALCSEFGARGQARCQQQTGDGDHGPQRAVCDDGACAAALDE